MSFSAALRAQRARVQRHVAQRAVRAAPQPAAAVVPAHDRATSCASTPAPRRCAARARRRADVDARRVPGRRRLFARSSSSTTSCRWARAIWSARRVGDARVPGAVLRRLLRPPRLPERRRPAGVADGARRLARVRRALLARRRAPACGCRRRWRRSGACPTQVLVRTAAGSVEPLRPRRSWPATRDQALSTARRRRRRPSAKSSARCRTRQRSGAAHRRPRAAAAPAGAGRVELPPAARSAASRRADLRHERAAGPAACADAGSW